MDRSFLEETVSFWQPHYSRPFTQEDARQAIANVTGFFTVLNEWSEKMAAQASSREDTLEGDENDSYQRAPQGAHHGSF